MLNKKEANRKRRHLRIRKRIKGTLLRPRLVITRSLLYTYAQLVDDEKRNVLLSCSDMKSKAKGTKTEKAKQIGLEIAKLAKEKNIQKITFDRKGYAYHGRVKAVADGAREGGLIF